MDIKLSFSNSDHYWLNVWMIMRLLPVLSAIVLVMIAVNFFGSPNRSLASAVLIAIPMLLFIPAMLYLVPGLLILIAVITNKLPQRNEIALRESEIIRRYDGAIISLPWDRVKKITEKDRGFYFTFNPRGAALIPKRQLNSEMISEIRAIIRSHVPDQAKLVQA